MKSMIVNLAVNDIASTIIYYRENFDFELQMLVDESKTIFDTIFFNCPVTLFFICSPNFSHTVRIAPIPR